MAGVHHLSFIIIEICCANVAFVQMTAPAADGRGRRG